MSLTWPERFCEPERMDDPDLDPDLHRAALRGLARLNRLSGAVRHVWRPILRLHQTRPERTRPLRIFDIASGSGDILFGLHREAGRRGVKVELHGSDLSPVAVEAARGQAERLGAGVQFRRFDALNGAVPEDFDVVLCSLFFHHLSNEQAERLLRSMAHAARQLVVVSDLRRSYWNWLQVWTGARLVTRSPVVHVDGPRSVRAAFTIAEIRQLAERAGMSNAAIRQGFPCRFLLTWQPASTTAST